VRPPAFVAAAVVGGLNATGCVERGWWLASYPLSDSASSGERSAVTLRGSSTSRLSMSIAAARSVAVEAPSM